MRTAHHPTERDIARWRRWRGKRFGTWVWMLANDLRLAPPLEVDDCEDLLQRIRSGLALELSDSWMPPSDSDDSYNRFVTRNRAYFPGLGTTDRAQIAKLSSAAAQQLAWEEARRARQLEKEAEADRKWREEEARREHFIRQKAEKEQQKAEAEARQKAELERRQRLAEEAEAHQKAEEKRRQRLAEEAKLPGWICGYANCRERNVGDLAELPETITCRKCNRQMHNHLKPKPPPPPKPAPPPPPPKPAPPPPPTFARPPPTQWWRCGRCGFVNEEDCTKPTVISCGACGQGHYNPAFRTPPRPSAPPIVWNCTACGHPHFWCGVEMCEICGWRR